MILVDSSVWIDYFRGKETWQANCLDSMLGVEPLAIGDLILTEILQGTDSNKEFTTVLSLLNNLDIINLGGEDVAIQAAKNFRSLRKKGITVRKTIDCVIATRCIMDKITLLHNDKDFFPFAKHLNLKIVIN